MIFRILIVLGMIGYFLIPATCYVMSKHYYSTANKILKVFTLIWGTVMIITIFTVILIVPM